MNKKALLKIVVSALACMGFAVISNRMPALMGAVYQAVFGEFDHTDFLFVMGLFVVEIVVLQKWGKDMRCRYLCLGTAIIASFIVLSNGDTNFTERLAPGANTTLIYGAVTDQNVLEEGRQNAFVEYYFDGKNLIVPGAEIDNEEYQYIYRMAVPARRVVTGQECAVTEKEAGVILSYPVREYGSGYFVLDEFWERTDHIRMAKWGEKDIFCSEELLDVVLNHPDDVTLSGEGVDLLAYAEKGSYREAKQTFVILLLVLIGSVIVLPLWGRDYPYLALLSSLPVGAAVWCIACVLFMAFNIPYNVITVLTCTVLGAGIRLFRKWNKFKELDWTTCFNFALLAVVTTVFFACFKICNVYADSVTRCTYGYRMAIFGGLRDVLENIAPFGMLEPMIMSMGYLFKCDALYVFYPLMAISGIGIMCAGLYYVNGRKDNYMAAAILGAGIVLLFSNFDYMFSTVLMAVHGPTAVYFLMFFVFIIMKKQMNIEKYEWIVVLAATVILLTRIEGAVYIMFFLALSLGIENEFLKLDKVIPAVAGVLITWNVFQMIMIGRDGNPMFWTPERGALLIAGALFVVVAAWIFRRSWPWLNYVKNHYFLYLAGGICLATIVVVIFVKRDVASINLPVFLSHFSNNEGMNNRINAGAFWTFILLLCPIVIKSGRKAARYTVSMLVGYIVLIYFICLFRDGAPLHYGYYDSGRKTLVQIMPAAIWLLAYSAGDREHRVKIKDEKYIKK